MSIEEALKEILENATHQGGTTYGIEEKYIKAGREALMTAYIHSPMRLTWDFNDKEPQTIASGKSEQIDTPYYCSNYHGGNQKTKCFPQCHVCRKVEAEDDSKENPKLCECGHMDCQHEDYFGLFCNVPGCQCNEFKEVEGPNQFNLFQH